MKGLFNFVNSVVGGEPEKPKNSVLLPWEDYKERAKLLNIRGSLTDVLRDKILEIPFDEKIFFSKSSQSESFVLDNYLDVILKLLEADSNLRETFRKLVPTKVSEDVFWKNYFGKVEDIKNEVFLKFSNKAPIESNE